MESHASSMHELPPRNDFWKWLPVSLHVGHHSVPLLDLCLSTLHSSDAARCGDRLGQYGSEVKGLLGDDNGELPYCYVVHLLRPVPCAQVLEPFHLEGAGNTKRRTSWAICQAFQVSSKKRRGAETGDIASGVASTSLIELTIAELANDASWRWIIIAHGFTIVWASSTTSISTCCSSTVWWLFSSLWSLCQRQCGELLRSLLLS